MEVHQFPCLNDNYSFLLHDPNSGATAVVDTPEVAPIEAALAERGWTLTHILNTHHHWDHTGGNEELKKRHPGVRVIGPARETKGAIPGLDRAVVEGDVVELGAIEARVLDTPGHTAGHVCYHFPSERKIFVGDTLFAMGCGRLFEGTPGGNTSEMLTIFNRCVEIGLRVGFGRSLLGSIFNRGTRGDC